jgi:hypothetical protein
LTGADTVRRLAGLVCATLFGEEAVQIGAFSSPAPNP